MAEYYEVQKKQKKTFTLGFTIFHTKYHKSKYQEQLGHNIYLKAAMIHATVGKVFNTNMSKSLLFIKEPSLIK